ncbi:MAG: DUF421 domain-containing protein [Acidimicrobiia bacterium]|nr:DUF421 domain-containing protein [Acidimicrobiia bacterium]
MVEDWITTSWTEIALVVVSSIVTVAVVIVYVRIAGLRTFAKMSSFDFAITLAIGSIIATTALTSTPLVSGLASAGVLIFLKIALARLRRFSSVAGFVDNEPILLMEGPELIESNLRRAGVSVRDIREKLREANVLRMEDVKAVVFETTGDISVLHGEGPLDPELLEGVRRS